MNIDTLVFLVPALLIAISVHECAHALTAYLLGDATAKNQGRITLNPLSHLDPAGTIMLLLVQFGWGKPVPVNPSNFRRPVFYNILVALSGPFSNLCLALAALLWIKYVPGSPSWLLMFLQVFFSLNIILMIFNLLPIPPLDGGHLLEIFAQKRNSIWLERVYRYGPVLLFSLLMIEFITHLPLLSRVLGFLYSMVSVFLYSVT